MTGLSFLRTRPAQILTLALLLQAGVFYSLSRAERVPQSSPLEVFPRQFRGWTLLQQGVVEKEVQEVLQADDLLTRYYANPEKTAGANLFIAYFRSQRTGKAPHSPKNCLPGSGWVPSVADVIPVSISGRPEPIEINRYIVGRGDQKSVVLYWYQSRDRVVASEYKAKFFVAADAIRYNRTDTALVRVVVPVSGNDDQKATNEAVRFVQAFFPELPQFLPV